MISPLLEPVPVGWDPPPEPVEAVLFTSPQGPRLAGAAADVFRRLPVYAVGERTAVSARESGFSDVRVAGGDVAALLAAVAASGVGRALHLTGTHRTEAAVPAGLQVVARAVYEARLSNLTPDAAAALHAGSIDWVLLFSSRTAAHFARLHDSLGVPRAASSVAAISAAALERAGPGWRRAVAAQTPNEAGILAAAGLACDKPEA